MKKLVTTLSTIIAITAIGAADYFYDKNNQLKQRINKTTASLATQKKQPITPSSQSRLLAKNIHTKNNNNQSVEIKSSLTLVNLKKTTHQYTQKMTKTFTKDFAIAKNTVNHIVDEIRQATPPVISQPRTITKSTQTASNQVTQTTSSFSQSNSDNAFKLKTKSTQPLTSNFNIAGINPQALKLGMNAYNKLKAEGKVNGHYLTIIDFSKPSTDPNRLSVIDVNTQSIVMHGLVAHGKGSGNLNATKFSNQFGTDASSLGAYLTTTSFDGKHGLSLHLTGLEKGINNNANARTIEIHPAAYVSESFIKQTGHIGRSWGCFAVNPEFSKKLINTIKNGTVLFAYAEPENHDPFVNVT